VASFNILLNLRQKKQTFKKITETVHACLRDLMTCYSPVIFCINLDTKIIRKSIQKVSIVSLYVPACSYKNYRNSIQSKQGPSTPTD